MGRTSAYFFVLLGAVAAGWTALIFSNAMRHPLPLAQDDGDVAAAGAAPDAPAEIATASRSDLPFLPIFGVAPVPAPPVDAPAATNEAPSFDYRLKGVIASGSMRWAVFAGNNGDVLVREGDSIGNNGRVAQIYAEGVDIALGDDIINMTFSETDPVEVAAFETPAQAPATQETGVMPRPEPQQVIYQNMSREEILAVLQKAEENRRARGWVPATE